MNEDIIENGISPLDGILPKDFGGDMLSDLLDKKVDSNMVNGVLQRTPMPPLRRVERVQRERASTDRHTRCRYVCL